MSSILKLDKSYFQALADSKPSIISVSRPTLFGLSTEEDKIIIPPLNTDITIPPNMSLFQPPPASTAFRAEDELEGWSWIYDPNNDDSEELKKIKKQLCKPPNQYLCGSCWAVSTASAISDIFVIQKKIPNPLISSTYCLACFKQHQCGGGNPITLLQKINEKGVASNRCLDYSWCSQDAECNGDSWSHFNASDEQLNKKIPDCGCYNPSSPSKHYLFTTSKPEFISTDYTALNDIKRRIIERGPVIGGFHVYSDFKGGKFYNTKGIYIQSPNSKWVGSHAVVIMGWGVEKDVNVNGTIVPKVSYWICRNSWGVGWGSGGYFKIGMQNKQYNINLNSCLEKMVVVNTPEGNYASGGITVFDADTIKPSILNKINFNKPREITDSQFYERDLLDEKEVEKEYQRFLKIKQKEKIISYTIIGVLVVGYIVLYFFTKKSS